jgi:glycosyltransferase involved in cell wall biosynthesis
MKNGDAKIVADFFPRITVVTPSFNQAAYLERTIRSVLDQDYPNLEYIIVDGGSTDGSVDIIRRYADRLAWWVSGPDQGQTDAINKGLRRATGEWVAWQNSDDIYYPGAFHDLAAAAAKHPQAGLIIGDMILIDEHDHPLRDIRYVKPSYKALLAEGMLLANQATFWRRNVHEMVGLLDESYHCAFDYEWFLRLAQHAEGWHVGHFWGALRLHGETKTSLLAPRFQEEFQRILAGREMPSWQKKFYRLRRLALMLEHGQISYVLRGILRRVRGLEGNLY